MRENLRVLLGPDQLDLSVWVVPDVVVTSYDANLASFCTFVGDFGDCESPVKTLVGVLKRAEAIHAAISNLGYDLTSFVDL